MFSSKECKNFTGTGSGNLKIFVTQTFIDFFGIYIYLAILKVILFVPVYDNCFDVNIVLFLPILNVSFRYRI
jgi:hypothetical protein